MDYNPSPRDPHKLPLPGFGQFSREELNKFMARTCAPVPTVPWSTGDRHCFKDKIPSSKSQNTDQPLHWENKQEAQSSFTLPQVQQTHNDIPKSWADVVRPNSENSPKGPGTVPPLVNKPTTPNKQAKSVSSPINGKPKAGGLSGILQSYTPTFSSRLLQPRGLVNNGNMCFMNAILQPLSHCPPFYNLLINIGKEVSHNFNSKTPLVDSLIMFMREFRDSKIEEHNGEEFGDPFLPEYVYDALRGAKRFDSMKGRQEDAEEFLGFLLDGLHEELLAASRNTSSEKDGQVESTGDQNSNDGDWFIVEKNKQSSTRSTEIQESPISRIFGGQVRSVLKCPGSSDSITLQPFSSLQLDIQPDDIKTVEDALTKMSAPEIVHDYYSPKKGTVVEANKRLYLDTFPPILILHLKRFIYDNVGGTQKLHKTVCYSTELVVQPDIITQTQRQRTPIQYKLFGVVYHHGKSATGGHYTCDILRQNNQWLHIDDITITTISAEDVAVTDIPTQPTDRLAYLLFYMRS